MSCYLDHERLEVYRFAIEFVVLADEIVENLPRTISFGIPAKISSNMSQAILVKLTDCGINRIAIRHSFKAVNLLAD